MLSPNTGLLGNVFPRPITFIEKEIAKAAIIIRENRLAFDEANFNIARDIHIRETIFIDITKSNG